MADINTIIQTIGAAIMSSAEVDTWARITYGRACVVFENCDPRNAPGETDCPLIIVYPLLKSGGLSQENKVAAIGLACWVYDSGTPESIEGVQRFDGGRNVEALRKLVLNEVVGCLPGGLHLADVATEYSVVEDFPLVSADMELTITEEKLIGQNPFE
jgi:hypothetical protein